MNGPLQDDYRAALGAFLSSPDEEARERAYDIGRHAIRVGLGVLDVARLHARVVEERVDDPGLTPVGAVPGAWQFFAEVLASYEMVVRGVREANATLQRFNLALEERVAQRTADLRETEKQLRERSAVLESVLDGMAEALVVVGPDGVVTLVNPATSALFGGALAKGVGAAGVGGFRLMRAVDGRPVPLEEHPVVRALAGGVVRGFEAVVRREGREDLHLEVSASPLRAEGGGGSGAVVVFRDVTARRLAEAAARRAEEQLARAQRLDAIGQLAGGVAHDFNNLTAVILSYASLLARQLPDGSREREDLGEIERAATSAATLTRQLLAFGRRQVLHVAPLDLNAVVQDTARMLGRTLGENIRLVTALAPDLPPVLADRGQMEQVLVNLVVNARDAMPGGGTVTLETREAEAGAGDTGGAGGAGGRFVALSVTDTGTGMDAATKARIFEPFFTTKELGRGTGLGLATVYGIVHQSGGRLTVYSEPGRGSTFTNFLPVAPDAPAAREPTLPPEQLNGTETVLLVEDNDLLRAAAHRALRTYGYEVLVAEDAERAVAASRAFTGRIHLLLTDVAMPGRSGVELAAQLARERTDMRVLFTSGYAPMAATGAGGLPAGAPFVEKPFTAPSLVRAVRRALA